MEIWKFKLDNKIVMPVNAVILYIQFQHIHPCIWALVDPKAEKETREFRIYGTGQMIEEFDKADEIIRAYIGTYTEHKGTLVWHVIELE